MVGCRARPQIYDKLHEAAKKKLRKTRKASNSLSFKMASKLLNAQANPDRKNPLLAIVATTAKQHLDKVRTQRRKQGGGTLSQGETKGAGAGATTSDVPNSERVNARLRQLAAGFRIKRMTAGSPKAGDLQSSPASDGSDGANGANGATGGSDATMTSNPLVQPSSSTSSRRRGSRSSHGSGGRSAATPTPPATPRASFVVRSSSLSPRPTPERRSTASLPAGSSPDTARAVSDSLAQLAQDQAGGGTPHGSSPAHSRRDSADANGGGASTTTEGTPRLLSRLSFSTFPTQPDTAEPRDVRGGRDASSSPPATNPTGLLRQGPLQVRAQPPPADAGGDASTGGAGGRNAPVATDGAGGGEVLAGKVASLMRKQCEVEATVALILQELRALHDRL